MIDLIIAKTICVIPNFSFEFTTDVLCDYIFIRHKNDKSYCRIYRYKDDKKVMYLEGLFVNSDIRKNGAGNNLLKLSEKIMNMLNVHTACLSVEKNTWIYFWYKRNGYVDYLMNDDIPNNIWMRKNLN